MPLTTPPANEESAPRSSTYKWQIVAMLWLICFFNYADRQAIFSIFPLLKDKFHFTKEELGRIGLAFTVVYALAAPFAGQVGDRIGRKALIVGGLYFWSVITGMTALCSRVWQFIAVRGVEGLGETFYFPASMSVISDYHGKATRSRAMSLHQTSVYVGTIGGGSLAGWMASRFGWQWPFIFLATAGVALGMVLATVLREPARNEADSGASGTHREDSVTSPIPMIQFLREWIRTPTAVLLVLAFFGANTVAQVFLVWMPTFLKEKFKLDLAQAGAGATVFIQTASMIGAAGAGVVADRWRARLVGGRILTQAVGALLGAPCIYYCGLTRQLWALVVAMTLFGLCKGIYDANIWASLYEVIPPSRRGAAVGVMNMIGWLGGGVVGAYGIGLAVDRGASMSVAIASTAILYVIVAALLFIAGGHFAKGDVAQARSGSPDALS